MTSSDYDFPTAADSAVESLRSMIGQQIRRGRPYIEELDADAVRHWALGIGDRNPLWIDPDHETASGEPKPAPPTILYATDKILSGYVTGLPGVHAMFAGTTFNFTRPPRVGDRITGTATLKELKERPSKFAGRSWQQIYSVDLRDAQGEVVANTESYCFRTERDAARSREKYEAKPPIVWSEDDVAEFSARYRAQEEARRGAVPRYVEEVTVGDQMPELIKGPYTATTAIAFLLGWGGLYVRAHGDAFELFDRHSALAIPNENGIPEPPERVHWDPDLAARVGVPGAYDYGPERVSWMGHLVTDWMGDAGFMRNLSVEVRRHNLIGELVTCKGSVTAVDLATGVVALKLEATNQNGEESARGTAQVVLPRGAGASR